MNSQYKELTDKAFLYHQNGDLASAAKIYQSLLEINPDDANILNLSGLLMIAAGKPVYAVDYLTKAFIINHSSGIASNLAKAYYACGENEKAVKMYLEALKQAKIEDDANIDDIYYSLGLAYKKAGNITAAEEAYKNALDENPGNYSACYNLSLIYSSMGDIKKALSYAEKCAVLRHDDDTLFGMLSGFYEQLNNYPAAVKALKKAAELNPENYIYCYNAAVLYSYMNKEDKAVYYYLKAISINPEHVESYLNLANIIKKQDNSKAVEYLTKAYKINPKEENLLLSLAQSYKDLYKNAQSLQILKELAAINPACTEAYNLAAMNYMDICNYDKALEFYNHALKLQPDSLDIQHGRAVCLKYLGRINECLSILEKITAMKDAPLESKITLGMLYLQNKDFKKGAALYRLRSDDLKASGLKKDDIWQPGSDIKNKTVLVYANCGLGDSIMYSRYLPMLKEKAFDVILQIDDTLAPLMQRSFPDIKIIKKSVKPPIYDTILQFMDIQSALDMDLNSIPSSCGYLKADENLERMFSKLQIFKDSRKKIGLFRQGNRRIFKNRFISEADIMQLASNKNFCFYSFQIDNEMPQTDNLFSLKPYIRDYSDTAALLKSIDVLVTIDSSIAHAAGALGVKTYLLLPKTAEWRWFYDTNKTSWYDSVTIFKQTKSAGWLEVLARVNKALEQDYLS